jgi:hypothetical protein
MKVRPQKQVRRNMSKKDKKGMNANRENMRDKDEVSMRDKENMEERVENRVRGKKLVRGFLKT